MSTRSTTHFIYGDEKTPTAIIYRHSDGYPEVAGADLLEFIEQCAALADSRLDDPSYLAAKYVVYLADKFNYDYTGSGYTRNTSKLDFLSVGVVNQDPGDIEYRYVVDCKREGDPFTRDKSFRPKVTCYKLTGRYGKDGFVPPDQWTLKEVEIPKPVADDER